MAKITYADLVILGDKIKVISEANFALQNWKSEVISLLSNLGDGDIELGLNRVSETNYNLKAAKFPAISTAVKDAANNL